jgi:hypothetical protein
MGLNIGHELRMTSFMKEVERRKKELEACCEPLSSNQLNPPFLKKKSWGFPEYQGMNSVEQKGALTQPGLTLSAQTIHNTIQMALL